MSQLRSVGLQGHTNAKDLLVLSAESTAVSSPCTWTEVIGLDNSSDYLLKGPLTSWFRTCSSRNLDFYDLCREEGSAAVVDLLGTQVLPIFRITRNAYSSPYWLFYRVKRHLTLISHLLQRYKHRDRVSTFHSTSRWRLYNLRFSSLMRMVIILMIISIP